MHKSNLRPGHQGSANNRGKIIAVALLIAGALALLAVAYFVAGKTSDAPSPDTSAPSSTETTLTEPAPPHGSDSAHASDPHHDPHRHARDVTVPAQTLLTALQSRGWRPLTDPTRAEPEPGSLQLHARLNKGPHTVDITLFQFKDLYAAQDIANKTRSPGEAITFGTTVARVTPDDSTHQSLQGSQQVAALLREFKSIANHL